MYIDQTQTIGHELLCQSQARLDNLIELDLIEKLKPTFSKDGNQFCYLYGELPNDCVIGFGKTAALAMRDFYINFHNNKAVDISKNL